MVKPLFWQATVGRSFEIMKVRLFKRHYGVHTMVKETEIDGTLRRYIKKYDGEENKNRVGDFYTINEERLIGALPKNFLPVEPSKVLVCVQDKSKMGSTGQSNLSTFRNWAKYFDSYSIELCR